MGRQQKKQWDEEWEEWAKRVEEEVRILKKGGGEEKEKVIRFTQKEVEKALMHFKPEGAPGEDQTTVKMFREGHPDLIKLLTEFFQMCWDDEEVPLQFLRDVIVPIFKKGNPTWPANYRPISLMETMAKVFQKLIYDRVLEAMREHGYPNPPCGKVRLRRAPRPEPTPASLAARGYVSK